MSPGIWIAVWRRVRRDDRAQDLIEYALLVGLVTLVAVTAISDVGSTIVTPGWSRPTMNR